MIYLGFAFRSQYKKIFASSQKTQAAIQRGSGHVFHFDSILLKAVDMALVNTLGTSATAAIKFYVDTSLICQNPTLFNESLNKIFGSSEKGKGIIEEKIKQFLADILRTEYSITVPVEEWANKKNEMTLGDFIIACKKEYTRNVSP